MSHMLSSLTYYVPGLLRPSVVRELYGAHYSHFGTKGKIEEYCNAAGRLYNEGCVYSAKLPLYLASKVVHAKIENDCFGNEDRVEWLCKIAQLRSLLAPAAFPLELTEAVSLAAQIPDRNKNSHHFLWSKIFCEMGKAFIAAGNNPQAKTTLESARKFAMMERALESVDALCLIAGAEKQIDEKAAEVTLTAALERVPGMWPGTTAKVGRLVTISNLYFSFNPEKSAEVLDLANKAIKEFASHQEGEIAQSKELVNGALSPSNAS